MVQLSNIARKVVVNIKGLDTENEVLSEEIKTIERRFKRFKSSVLLRADDEFRDGSAYVVSDDDAGIIQALLEAGSAPAGAKNPIWMLLQGRLCVAILNLHRIGIKILFIILALRNAAHLCLCKEPVNKPYLYLFCVAAGDPVDCALYGAPLACSLFAGRVIGAAYLCYVALCILYNLFALYYVCIFEPYLSARP